MRTRSCSACCARRCGASCRRRPPTWTSTSRATPRSTLRDLPAEARIVIVGGGVAGASIAYHLAQLGEPSLLVDRNQLTSGSTFHSAGLVGQLRGSVSLTRMMMDSVELYRTLDCGWVECGGLRLGSAQGRWGGARGPARGAEKVGVPPPPPPP